MVAKAKKALQGVTNTKLERFLPYLLIFAGIVGILAAGIITQDKLELAANPNFKPSCSLNPVISCGSVMVSKQAHAFGFPNPFIGLVGFPILVTTGVLLLSGVKPKRWWWWGMQAGLTFGVLFAHWLAFQSVYRIHALCIYCMCVWVVVIASFWYVTLYNLQLSRAKIPAKLLPVVNFARKHHLDLLILWYLIIFFLIMHHFWYYFGKHLPF